MLPTILSTIAGKLAAAGVAGAVAVGGLGAAGALPDPVQEEVAELASHAGVELPVPDDADAPAAPDLTEIPVPDELPDPARAGMERAAALRDAAAERAAAARAHAASILEWTGCVRESAAAHDEADGEFDPEATCGPRPVLTMPTDPNGESDDPDGAETEGVRTGTAVPDDAPVPESVPPVSVPPVSVPETAPVPQDLPIPPPVRGSN